MLSEADLKWLENCTAGDLVGSGFIGDIREMARECLALRAEVARLRAQLNQACLDRDGARIRLAQMPCGCLHDPHCLCHAALTDPATVERVAWSMYPILYVQECGETWDDVCKNHRGRVEELRTMARAALAALEDVKPPATRNLP